MFWTAFVVAGIKKRKQKRTYPSGIKKKKVGGRFWLFFFKRQSVPSMNRVLSLKLWGLGGPIMACSAGQTEGTNTHLGCGICPESRLRIVPSPGHSRHVDTCHIFSDPCTSNREWGQFLLFCNLPRSLHYPRYAWSHPRSHQHWASTRRPFRMSK